MKEARFDIAPFGLPNCASGEIRFEEPRDVREVAVTFAGPAPRDLELCYMRKTWPETRWELSREKDDPFYFGWSRRDDQFNCAWQKAKAVKIRKGRTVRFKFLGLGRELPKEAKGYDVDFRRTLGLRLCAKSLPPVRKWSVSTCSAPAATRLRLEFDAGRRTRRGIIRLAGYNAKVRPGQIRSGGSSAEIRVAHMLPAHRYSGDSGHVTFIQEHDSFTVSLEDLARQGPVWYEREGIFVARGEDSTSFAQYRARNRKSRTTMTRIEKRGDHSLAAAMLGQPRPHPDAYSLGLKHARQKFWLEPNGDLVLHRRNVARVQGKDTPRYMNRGDARVFFGLEGWIPAARFAEPAPVPVYNIHLKKGDILLELKALCAPLYSKLGNGETPPDEDMVALLRFRFRNLGDAPVPAGFSIRYSQDSSRGYNIYSGGRSRNEYLVPESPPDRLAVRGKDIASLAKGRRILRLRFGPGFSAAAAGESVTLSRRLKPKESCDLLLKVPYLALAKPGELRALDRLNFERCLKEAAAFWRYESRKGSQLLTPDEHLNAVYAAHLTHVLMTDSGMPGENRLVNTSVGTSTYGNFSNESCMIVQELEQRGLAEECRRRLEIWVKYQGTAPQPGNFTDYDGMFFGAGGFEDGAYNQHHGWVLWALAEHFLLTRDRRWFMRIADSLIRGADWIFRQRRNTIRDLPHSRGWERGFLPAGSLEDVTDFNYWLSTNALTWRGADRAATALEAAGHPEARRVRMEADAYRADLKTGLEKARRTAPLARLKDGRWVPRYPPRLYARERDYGWIREVLEGAVYLLISGLYDSCGEEAEWILNDYQDNLYHLPPFGYPLLDQERNLPFRGGFSMQPNLLAGLMPHLDRDEPEIYLWMFFNAFASCYREEIGALIEHPSPELGFSNSAHFKTSDEANSVMWLRYMLVYATPDLLHLGRALPRAWLKEGREAAITKAATYFGEVSLRYTARGKRVKLEAELAGPQDAPKLLARFRLPGGRRIGAVRVNGKSWRRFDPKRGDVDLTGLRGKIRVEAVCR